MTAAKFVEVQIDGAIAQITLNRPDVHNAITGAVHHALHDAFMAVRAMVEIRAIVFAARGKNFSAGGDFDEILADRADPSRVGLLGSDGKSLFMAIADCHLPVITALQGDAVGLGATLILASDAIFAARTAKISDPHVVIGLTAGDGGCATWPQHIGLLRAKRYLLSGDRISAVDAHAMGLITDLVETPHDALPAARAYAARLAALPPLAVQSTKCTLNKFFRDRIEAIFDYGMARELETFVSDDVGEAIAAFREKRTPTYTGR